MPGLVPPARPKPLRRREGPGIHVFPQAWLCVDGRVKPGHDAWGSRFPASPLPADMGPGLRQDDTEDVARNSPGLAAQPERAPSLRLRLSEPVVQRVACAADGADRVLLAARVEQFAKAADVDVDGALIDIDVAAPDAVEQLLAREHPARMLQEELQQAILGRAEINGTARTRHAA